MSWVIKNDDSTLFKSNYCVKMLNTENHNLIIIVVHILTNNCHFVLSRRGDKRLGPTSSNVQNHTETVTKHSHTLSAVDNSHQITPRKDI